ncbi:serine/threonine protein kinase, partial [Planctomycetota bacterium]|nr:serine/threonine protein kinase [Planctomycetota bacterium]
MIPVSILADMGQRPREHSDTLLDAPQRVGRFELIREIGRGAHAVVYLARDTERGVNVAVKVLPRLLKRQVRERFLREVRVLSGFDHPGLLRLVEVTSHRERPFLITEYVGEHTLQSLRLPRRQAVRTLTQVAAAVQAVHDQGVIHRDLKPAPVLLRDGTPAPVVADLGLARLVGEFGLTHPGVSLGTPAYMAPEQWAAQPAGPASDVYALGGMLYHALVDLVPFVSPDMGTLAWRVRTEDPTPPRSLDPSVAPALERICLKALAKQAEDRFASAAEFGRALEQWLLDSADSEGATLPSTRTAGPQPTAGPVSKSFGGYELRGVLGQGGMGVVYRAWDPEASREVAIKIIASATGGRLQRFERERRAMAMLDHSCVVRVHAAGESRGVPYLVMDLIEGVSLEERIAEGVLSGREAAEVVRKLSSAVAAAHAVGVLHRDLKPDNVILAAPSGEPRLMDFGLAKELDLSGTGVTADGRALGTPGYWPPEQALGEVAKVGPRSDVYGLGAVLYAALTGRAPFERGTLVEHQMAVAGLPLVPPSEHVEVDRGLEAICLQCLEKLPGDRYPSAAALE